MTVDLYGDGIGRVELVDSMGSDLTVVNAARVSYGGNKQELDEKDKRLIKYLIKNSHTSPFEHCQITFKFTVPLFVRSQHHRHRTWCIAGDTHITFNQPKFWKNGIHRVQYAYSKNGFTIKELYRKWNTNLYLKNKVKSLLLRVCDESNGKFTVSSIEDIIFSGKKEVFEVLIEDGYKIKCTKFHKILTTNGWQTLEEAVGLSLTNNNTAYMTKECFCLVNGNHSPWQDKRWLQEQRFQKLSVQEIADNAGCSYHTIRKWLKIHDLKFSKKERSVSFLKNGKPWNYGKFGYNVNKQPLSKSHLEAIRKARSGPNCNFWKGGISSDRANIARWTTEQAHKVHKKYNYTCQHCQKIGGKLHTHHIQSVSEFPELAKDFNNLETLCADCHRKYHGQLCKGTKIGKRNTLTAIPRKVLKVTYLGEEDTYDIVVKGPHHNFLGNGVVIHNSFNEVSRRYTADNLQFYYPEKWRTQSTDNKQCSDNEFDSAEFDSMLIEHCQKSLDLYNEMVEGGVAREMARMVLPQNLYTSYYGSVSLHNAMHFLELRLHPHAQWEIQRVAEAMKTYMYQLYPHCMKIWSENV